MATLPLWVGFQVTSHKGTSSNNSMVLLFQIQRLTTRERCTHLLQHHYTRSLAVDSVADCRLAWTPGRDAPESVVERQQGFELGKVPKDIWSKLITLLHKQGSSTWTTRAKCANTRTTAVCCLCVSRLVCLLRLGRDQYCGSQKLIKKPFWTIQCANRAQTAIKRRLAFRKNATETSRHGGPQGKHF